MAIQTNYKTALQHKIFGIISQASQELNVDSYVIGGFVRDLLLNRGSKKILMLLPLEAESNWL